ncbi:sporulation protein [Guptibacillus algicola]|uniref:sporulation protein n=1 Tax=Guptibacillus algicola TaxID=225844 RepID=UPI001CD31B69|nr:sporulation protein [Alkalihalobacillus algicola]MCA0987580.1 sporulation protein [Alkalihalobacillus algicola]
MCLLGIGAAKIDLILEKLTFKRGELVVGSFEIIGGTIEQRIKRVECDLLYIDHAKKTSRVVDSVTILTVKDIRKEQKVTIPFSFRIPETIPEPQKRTSYKFTTRLVFSEGAKSVDQDQIAIQM